VRQEEHSPADARDAWGGLDDLQGGAKHVARGVASTSKLAIGMAALDDKATEVERVEHFLVCFFEGHPFLLAKLEQQLCIFLLLLVAFGVNDSGLFDVAKPPLLSETKYFLTITKDDEVGHTVGDDLISRLEGAFFRSLWQYNALAISFSPRNELFYEFHIYIKVSLTFISVLSRSYLPL